MEKELLERAELGEVLAMKELALLYEQQAKHFREPPVGESISIEEFFAYMEDGTICKLPSNGTRRRRKIHATPMQFSKLQKCITSELARLKIFKKVSAVTNKL